MTRVPVALTIAGSDSGGGAGIQADLKTFSALGVYGCSVIAALTAQNTRGVTGVLDIDPAFVTAQLDAVFADLPVDAVKIGMLGNPETIAAVADGLRRHKPARVVLDPVMVAKSGDPLLRPEAVESLTSFLLPLATVITPNLPEAAALLGGDAVTRRDDMERVARDLLALGPAAVLLKGGHLDEPGSPDFLVSADDARWFEGERADTLNTHGTGCTLSSAIAAGLAKGLSLADAVSEAKRYISAAIAEADTLGVGGGRGPVHHFHALWSKREA